nr:MAG: replication initiator protein [Microvirus sp.]
MACYRPVTVSVRPNGKIGFHDQPGDVAPRQIACGRCVGCRLDRASGWALRCQHEASLFDHNSFVTLTYDEENIPEYGSLRYSDVQKFLKRLRKRALGFEASPSGKYPIRFFAAGEYGEQFQRPHYHLLLFNFDFKDRKKISKRLFDSELLSELWPHGHASCGSVSAASAAYVSQYSMKKVYGRVEAERWYSEVDRTSGEVKERVPEFVVMSRRPGIGYWWYERYGSDVLPADYVVSGGNKIRVPRYYAQKFAESDPEGYELVKEAREVAALDRVTPGRAVAKSVAAEHITLSKRALLGKGRSL